MFALPKVRTNLCDFPVLFSLLENASICYWVPLAHTCNLSYSGGRDQEDHKTLPQKYLKQKGLV
jgi:hypothetical protein